MKGNQRAQRLFTQLLSTTERENKRLADEWLSTAIETELAELQQMLIDDPDCSYRHLVEDDIAHTRKMIAIIGRVIRD